MSTPDGRSAELRLLLLAPTGKDASLSKAILERADIECVCFPDLDSLCAELERGAAAVIVPEESLSPDRHDRFSIWLEQQEPWSDLPVLVLARSGADSAAVARAIDMLGNVTVMERPTRVSSLVSAARSALRARQRQYQIREHLAERERTAEALLANDRRKDEFLAMLAHELRNPLAPIVNSLRLLAMRADSDDSLSRIREMMDRQVSHMVRLVDDLLEISRITRGKIELRKELVSFSEVLRSVVDAIRPAVEVAKHELHVDMEAGELVVEADPVRLAQVLTNVLANAVKYTDPGGHIRLTVRREDDRVAVFVADSGRGIPAEMLPRVFDLFTQVENDPSRTQGGLGIGLTLVRRLVELHGGSVSAFSEGPGRGSEFAIRLPLEASHAAAGGQPLVVRSAAPFPRLRVLVVDDNRDAADSLAALLNLLGAETEVVYSGPDAIVRLASYRPSVILLDIGMPGMDGLEVARRIRRFEEYREITLIAMTGWGQEQDRSRTRDAGFDHHLTKPADVDTLASLLFRQGEEPGSARATG